MSVEREEWSRANRSARFAARVRDLMPSPRPHESEWKEPERKFRPAGALRSTLWLGSDRRWYVRAAVVGAPALVLAFVHPALAVVPFVAAFCVGVARREDVATRDDSALLEDLPEVHQTLVRLQVFHPHPVGDDRGVLWIDGDVLCFLGARSQFMLGPQDLEVARVGRRVRLKLRGAIPAAWLDLTELRFPDGRRLQTVLDAFAAIEGPTSSPRVFPPLVRGARA